MRAVALALLLVACGGEHDPDHDHGDDHDDHGHGEHGHGEGAIGITAWSERLELFAEHPPAVSGESLTFLAHLTVLDGFSPVEDARVRLSLEGPERLTAEADMLRSGIYELSLTPTAPGTYRGRVEVLGGGGEVGGFEVEVYPDAASADAAAPPEPAGRISFLKEQQWRVSFATAFAEIGELRASVEVTGALTTPPDGNAHVHAPVAGRVMGPARGAFPSPGDAVTAGQVLATIAPTPGAPEDAARASLTVVEAQARVEDARAELARVERMLADRAIPERRAAEARRALTVAEASLAAARRVNAVYASASSGRGRGSWRITSPIDGLIDRVDVSPGEAVQPDEQLFRVVNPNVIWVRADVPESWAARFVRDADASFLVVGDERWRPIRVTSDPPGARLAHVARSVDPISRTVRVVYELREPDDALRIGAAVRVQLPAGEMERGVVVPRSAVDDVQGRTVVYVQAEGESFEERVVRIGAHHGERLLVTDGLEPHERVVVRGAHLVHLASSATEAVGHQHPH